MSYTYKRAGKPSPEEIFKAIGVLKGLLHESHNYIAYGAVIKDLHRIIAADTYTELMEGLRDQLMDVFPECNRWSFTPDLQTPTLSFFSRDLENLSNDNREGFAKEEGMMAQTAEAATKRFVGPGYNVKVEAGDPRPGYFRITVTSKGSAL